MMRIATGGHMRIFASESTIAAGEVSLRVANTGSIVHELVVLPLLAGQRIGHRAVTSDGRVDETGSLGEAANPCGNGPVTGSIPGGSVGPRSSIGQEPTRCSATFRDTTQQVCTAPWLCPSASRRAPSMVSRLPALVRLERSGSGVSRLNTKASRNRPCTISRFH
jgi:hypothetical protein